MRNAMNADHDDLGAVVEDVAQEAIDAVAALYTSDATIEVDQHLRAQLASRGIRSVDEGWADEVSQGIRSGHPVRVGRPDASVQEP
jgi:ketosteroid isomerase-like protein